MTKCEVCNRYKITAWKGKKGICQKCWRVYKYGDMKEYLKTLAKRRKKT